jgi:hypothetical protein
MDLSPRSLRCPGNDIGQPTLSPSVASYILKNSIWEPGLMKELTKSEEILLWAIAELDDDA